MENNIFSFKELYDVYLKLTYPVEIGGKSYEEGETIAKFDKIQMAVVKEEKSHISATGGYGNSELVHWETTKSIHFNFSQGVFSKTQFALLSNSMLMQIDKGSNIPVTKTEEKESGEDKTFELAETPISLFIYRKDNGEKITNYSIKDKTVTLQEPFVSVIVEYKYRYQGGGQVAKIGQRMIAGYLELEGKTRVKDDTTGQVVTGLFKIPKLKLMSDLSMRLGTQANPMVANFQVEGVPVGSRGNSYVSEFYFLNNDIDSDI